MRAEGVTITVSAKTTVGDHVVEVVYTDTAQPGNSKVKLGELLDQLSLDLELEADDDSE